MALLCWLPLNGSVDNNGVGNITISGSQTYDNTGKIGKCLNSSATTSVVISELSGSRTWSVAFWGYVTSSLVTSNWTRIIQISDGSNNLRVEVCPSSYANGVYCYSTHNNTGYKITTASIVDVSGGHYDKWMHFCITSDGTTIRVYRDGVLSGSCGYDGSGTVTGGFTLENNDKIKKNDFRVYNTCLSPKEIEVLARGLVVHYPMTGGGRGCANLAKGSNTADISTNVFIFSEAAGGSTRTIEYDGGIPCAKITRNTTAHSSWQYLHYDNWDRAAIKPSTTYTLSFDIIGSGSGNIGFSGFMQGNATNSISASVEGVQNTFNSDKWSHLVFRTTTIADFTDKGTGQTIYMNCSFLNGVNTWIMMKNMKLEEGVNDTPWMPHTSDTAYTTMGYNDNIEYDVSGYNYHGTKIGSPTYSSDTPRYSTSTSFNGVDDCIQVPLNTFFPNAGSFTINLWFKKHEIGSKNYETVFGGISGFEMDTRNNSSMTLSYYVTGNNRGLTVQSPLSLDTWYMLTMVCDGTNELYYLNGEYKKQIEKKNMPTGNYFIGAWRDSVSQNFKGLISDFRVYSTALTATQVAELYNTSASIANNGTLLAYEFIEN